MGNLPLDGIRVAEVTAAWAGPYAGLLMADWGAEVIRVESRYRSSRGPAHSNAAANSSSYQVIRNLSFPNGDPGRRPWNRRGFINSHWRNKLSMTVDLTRADGQAIFHRLIAVCDILLENNVPSTAERLGITWEELSRINPRLILLRMPGYGLSGPYKDFRGLGNHMEAMAGHTLIRSYPDVAPGHQSELVPADAAAGAVAVFAAVMALLHRKRTGAGQLIELASAENFIPLLGDFVMDFTMNGRLWEQMGNTDRSMVPHNVYPCAGQDRWVAVACRNDEEWVRLCDVMGNPGWSKEARFADGFSRFQNRAALDELIGDWTRDKKDRWVMEALQAAGVPSGMVYDERDSFEDPHLNTRGFFEEIEHPEAGTHRYPGIQWKMRNAPNHIRRPPAMLGEHNEYIYKTLLGYSDEEFRHLENDGHIGMDYDLSVP